MCVYTLSMSSLGCKDLCIVISFLDLWFICLGASFVYFKNYYYSTFCEFFTQVLTVGLFGE